MGGKKRIGKQLAAIIQKDIDDYGIKTFRAPFVGMAGVTQHIDTNQLVICDLHPDVVAFWKKIMTSNWKPSMKLSKAEYEKWRAYKKPHWMRAFAGFGASFGGSFFASYRKENVAMNARSVIRVAAVMRQKRVKILAPKSYDKHRPKCNAVYCDPPYANTRGYSVGDFDHDAFWKKMVEWGKNNIVYVSERSLPPAKYRKHFKTVFRSAFKTTALTQNVGEVRGRTEYMFRTKTVPKCFRKNAK